MKTNSKVDPSRLIERVELGNTPTYDPKDYDGTEEYSVLGDEE